MCYWPVGLLWQRKNILSGNYDILIDGFQRSANTYAVKAFEASQAGAGVRIRAHHHSPAAVIAAVCLNKPAVVLIREPRDAVLSWTIRSGYPLDYAVDSYLNYYSALLPYLPDIVVAEFSQVTKDFGSIVQRINARFGSKFRVPSSGELCSEAIFDSIEDDFQHKHGFLDERSVSRPSDARKALKAQLSVQLEEARLGEKIEKARQLFNALVLPEATRPEALSGRLMRWANQALVDAIGVFR